MSFNRYNPKRDKNELHIIKMLKLSGVSVQRISAKDVPDLLCGFKGVTYLIEIKDGKGKLSPGQAKFHETWRGRKPQVAYNIDEALAIFGIK